MIARAARGADRLAARLPDTAPDKAAIRAKIARLAGECGCAMGGVFLIAASVIAATYSVAVSEPSIRLLLLSAPFVFVGALLGKLTGVMLAVVRLTVLRRRLAARLVAGLCRDRARQPASNGA